MNGDGSIEALIEHDGGREGSSVDENGMYVVVSGAFGEAVITVLGFSCSLKLVCVVL